MSMHYCHYVACSQSFFLQGITHHIKWSKKKKIYLRNKAKFKKIELSNSSYWIEQEDRGNILPILTKQSSLHMQTRFFFLTICVWSLQLKAGTLVTSQDETLLRSWNLFNKLDLNFSTSASSKESGADLITETAPAWCKALTASSEKLESNFRNLKGKKDIIVMVPLFIYPRNTTVTEILRPFLKPNTPNCLRR